MSFEHIDAFVKAASTVIGNMISPDMEAGKPFFNDEPLEKYEVAVLVGVLGDLQGQVICGMSQTTAKAIITRMLGSEVKEIDQLGASAICELKNIIVGTASTNLSLKGFRCNITPPLFLKDRVIPEFLKHIHTALAIPIKGPFGEIDMNLALQKDQL